MDSEAVCRTQFLEAVTRLGLQVSAKNSDAAMDGFSLPNDFYLKWGNETGKMLRSEIPLTANIPIQP